MKDKDDIRPELKVLGDQDQVDVPERLDAEPEDVELLKPEKFAPHEAKTFRPEVADILDVEEEEQDMEEEWGGKIFKAPPLGWFVLAGLVVTGLAFWATVSLFKAQPKLEAVVEEKDELEKARAKEVEEVRKTHRAMEKAMRGYLAAGSADELLQFVRHVDRVEPWIRDYYKNLELVPEKMNHLVRIRPLGLESYSFVNAEVKMENGETRYLILEQTGPERFEVDWESDVCFQPLPWERFIGTRALEPTVMRVFVELDDYHVFEFRDEEMFDCYRITVQDNDLYLYGYVKKDSAVAKDLKEYAKKNGMRQGDDKPLPLMLEIRFPKDSPSKRCVWIDALVEPRWLYVKSPQ